MFVLGFWCLAFERWSYFVIFSTCILCLWNVLCNGGFFRLCGFYGIYLTIDPKKWSTILIYIISYKISINWCYSLYYTITYYTIYYTIYYIVLLLTILLTKLYLLNCTILLLTILLTKLYSHYLLYCTTY